MKNSFQFSKVCANDVQNKWSQWPFKIKKNKHKILVLMPSWKSSIRAWTILHAAKSPLLTFFFLEGVCLRIAVRQLSTQIQKLTSINNNWYDISKYKEQIYFLSRRLSTTIGCYLKIMWFKKVEPVRKTPPANFIIW